MKIRNENFKEELENQYSILIQAEEKEQRKRTFAILTILSITLISTIISTIFAYKAFSNTTEISNEKKLNTETYYQTLSSVYNNGTKLEINNISTGYSIPNPKVITISNDGDIPLTFDLKIKNINTSLLSTNNLIYSITKNNQTSSEKELPLADTTLLGEVSIAPKETITYVFNVKYNGYTDTNNNYYNANIVVEPNNNKTNLLD